ncbi:hypothetical protein LINPERPRIM_LOCUS1253, partial [Linum perenne]
CSSCRPPPRSAPAVARRHNLLQLPHLRSAPAVVVIEICSSLVVVEICSSRHLQDTLFPDLLQPPPPRFGETVIKVSGNDSGERVS